MANRFEKLAISLDEGIVSVRAGRIAPFIEFYDAQGKVTTGNCSVMVDGRTIGASSSTSTSRKRGATPAIVRSKENNLSGEYQYRITKTGFVRQEKDPDFRPY